jgi:hypothetical protein
MINLFKVLILLSIIMQGSLFWIGLCRLTEGRVMLGLFLVFINLFGLYLNMMNVKRYIYEDNKTKKIKD